MPTRQEYEQLRIDFVKEKKKAWLKRAREHAWAIARARGEVSIKDIYPVCPPPDDPDIDKRIMGSVFRGMQWVRDEKSGRKICHNRKISIFKIP